MKNISYFVITNYLPSYVMKKMCLKNINYFAITLYKCSELHFQECSGGYIQIYAIHFLDFLRNIPSVSKIKLHPRNDVHRFSVYPVPIAYTLRFYFTTISLFTLC